MKYLLRIETEPNSYISVGTYDTAEIAGKIADQFSVRAKPKIIKVEPKFSDLVLAFSEWDGCSVNDALFEVAQFGGMEDIQEALGEFCITATRDEARELYILSAE